MKLLFCRSSKIGSILIRAATFSKWSHVAVVLNDGTAIEATWPRVRVTTAAEIEKTHTAHEYRDLVVADTESAIEFMRSQVGKPYDLGALLMYLNPWRKWTVDDKWFCSELVAASSFLFYEAGRVSPQMLYLLSRPTD